MKEIRLFKTIDGRRFHNEENELRHEERFVDNIRSIAREEVSRMLHVIAERVTANAPPTPVVVVAPRIEDDLNDPDPERPFRKPRDDFKMQFDKYHRLFSKFCFRLLRRSGFVLYPSAISRARHRLGSKSKMPAFDLNAITEVHATNERSHWRSFVRRNARYLLPVKQQGTREAYIKKPTRMSRRVKRLIN
jgi:hypothetical protein